MSPAFQHDRIRSGAGTPDPRLSRNAKCGQQVPWGLAGRIADWM